MPKLAPEQKISLGCDPEFFFTKDGKVIGSEAIIPKEGLRSGGYDQGGLTVIDGVQAELHPSPASCREILARGIRDCLITVNSSAGSKGVKVDFRQVVDIEKEELDKMADENKKFGCSESMNTHKAGINKVTTISADPLKYLKRSAGGHIHMGAPKTVEVRTGHTPDGFSTWGTLSNSYFEVLKNPEHLVPILDILVGNTCVMLDTDPANKERRKNYGKAGEYRLPSYGLEYRTLSNFWLRGMPLFSFAFGLARQAVNLCQQSTDEHDYRKELMSLVSMSDIRKAINNNDKELATRNFARIEDFLLSITKDDNYGFYPLMPQTIKGFHKLVEDGIDKYFTQDTIDAWTQPRDGYGGGFYQFITQIVLPQ